MKIPSHFFTFLVLSSAVSVTPDGFAIGTHAVAQNTDIDQAVAQLAQYATLQQQLNIQNADTAYGMKKALLMADLLIGTDGTLNASLRQSVQSAFISAQPEEYEVNMTKVLNQLDGSWQPFFNTVTAPQDPNCVGNTTLRALFSLAPSQPLTDRHAKVAVLAAMLAPYNQGPVGDCFAVSDVLRDHKEYLQHAASDYAALIMEGYLTRPVNNGSDYFFYLPILADDDRAQQFNLDASGTFGSPAHSLFDSPGFTAARALMGGDDSSCSTQEVMHILSNAAAQGTIHVTPEQVIQAIATVIASKNTDLNVADLCNLGDYAFSSLTNNPTLRGIEAAFAAMAEDRSSDSTRSNINSCVEQAMKPIWAQLAKYSGASQFHAAFTNTFNNSYRLLYNLNIPLAQVSADGSSTSGGFILFQRDLQHPTTMGTQVTTPQQFQQLVVNALAATQNALSSLSNVGTMGTQLIIFVKTNGFLTNALWDYDPSNKQEPDPVDNYLKLSRTPMLSCDGDNPFEVDDVDTETSYDKNVQTYTPSNTTALITWCMSMAKTATAEMAPMDSPQHAFNFMPKNPDLVNFVNSKASPGQWLQKTVIVPGMQVAKRVIDPTTQSNLSQAMWQFISSALTDETSYKNMVGQLAKSKLSVQAYSQKLLTGINHLLGSDANQSQMVANALDAMLLECLPAADQAILEQSAIRFAFTNWNEGLKDIYFCAYFNPRTEKIAFGTIFEDKTNLQPMDEGSWVNNQQWDVDLTPLAPANLASSK